jgi:MFS family permease
MGAARGIDEGLIGTTAELAPFQKKFGLKDPHKSKHEQAELLSNITSMVQMGSILGAMVAFYLTDKIGRLWATRLLCLIWVTGISIFLASSATGSIGMIYAGRFIAGIGIGQTTVVAPTYLAETAPRAIRGLCVCAFSGSVYLSVPCSVPVICCADTLSGELCWPTSHPGDRLSTSLRAPTRYVCLFIIPTAC